MDWDKLRIFYTVAQSQSFTKAGETLNLSQSAISRQVAALEERLQVTLFHRHARGLLLTEQGEILLRTVSEVFTKLAATENALMESKERPRGPLRITAPVAFGTTWLTPNMKEFHELYPEIQVTLIVDDRELDLLMREADAAIRVVAAKQPDLIQRSLVTLHNSVYASNDYLRERGVPNKPEDLDNHNLITYGDDGHLPFPELNWLTTAGHKAKEGREPVFKVNSLLGMLKAVESGLGIAALPDYMVQGIKGITRILPEMTGPTTEVYFTYASEMRHSKRIKVFKEFMQRKLAEFKY
jgi:DNA-binding transcriptional LysR family regulator